MNLAEAKDTGMDDAVATVFSEPNEILVLLPTGFGKCVVKHWYVLLMLPLAQIGSLELQEAGYTSSNKSDLPSIGPSFKALSVGFFPDGYLR